MNTFNIYPRVVNKDLRGNKFGFLTVTSKSKERRNGQAMWNCKCECGKSSRVRQRDLISGNTQSCGHLKKSPRRTALVAVTV